MRLLADAVLIAHMAYVSFVIGGLLLIWLGAALGWSWVRSVWFRTLHLAAIAFVALEALIGLACPLTNLEDWLRSSDPSQTGFVERWLHRLLYWDFPSWVFTAAYLAFAAVVVLTFIVLPPRRMRWPK